jgi:uncharacterized caspase-like protein
MSLIASAAISIIGIGEAFAERRVALVIGNAAYSGIAPLVKPVNDAGKMAEVLRRMGFDVILGTDASKQELVALAQRFSTAVKGADVGYFYYSGHGFQTNRMNQQHPVNHIVPVDFTITDQDASLATLALDVIVETLKREVRVGFIFMDACRSDPQLAAASQRSTSSTRSVNISRGFSPVSVAVEQSAIARLSQGKGPTGLLIAYATDPGNVAYEGENGPYSPFTTSLVKNLASPGLSIAEIMGRVSAEVAAETKGQQTPWSVSSLTAGAYQFMAPVVPTVPLTKANPPSRAPAGPERSSVPGRTSSKVLPAPVRPARAATKASAPGRSASAPPARSNLPPNLGMGVGAGL